MWIKTLKDCQGFIAGDGCTLKEYFHPEKQPLKVRYSLAHAVVSPREITRPHVLSTSEVYFILRGEGVMHIGEEEKTVTTCDVIYIPPGEVQHIENKSDIPLEFLCIVDPPWRKENEEIL